MSAADYSQLYADAGAQYGVDPALLMAQGQQESSGDTNAVGPDTKYGKAVGLAQLVPATAKALGVTDRTDPKQVIPAQAKLMRENLDRYGDVNTALMAYHGGTDKANWGPKTQAYPAQVLKHLPSGAKVAQNIVSDPLADALLNYKDDSAAKPDSKTTASNAQSGDPLADALMNYKDEPAQAQQARSNEKPEVGVEEDLLKTLPSAVAKGVGIIPQLPAMAGNAVANSMGYVTGKALGVSPEMQNKLNNINPFFTGNTLTDALIQSGKAIATGKPGQQNPLTGGILYDPQTTPGKLLQAGIEGGIAGPEAGGAGIPSALAGMAGEWASQALPNNPLVPLVAGGLTYAGAKGFTATPLASDQAAVIKGAENDFGIKVPSGVMTGRNNFVERLAGKSDTAKMTNQLNKTAADLIGANDAGGGHTTINAQSFLDAKKNNGAAYQALDTQVGKVPLSARFNDISDGLDAGLPSDKYTFGNVAKDISSKMQGGDIAPADVRTLTGNGSDLQKLANSPYTAVSGPATKIIQALKGAVDDALTPEQREAYKSVTNKYKLMSEFEPIANESGVGNKLTPQTIRNVINKAYSNVNSYETPAKNIGNLLNTIVPGNKYQSNISGLKNSGGSDFLPNAELGASVLMGEPLTGLALKYTPKAVSALASKYVNSNMYRNKLLQNSGY